MSISPLKVEELSNELLKEKESVFSNGGSILIVHLFVFLLTENESTTSLKVIESLLDEVKYKRNVCKKQSR